MILEGLVYLHQNRVVFCDLHAGNFVFNEFNMLKFADFGNAKFLENIKPEDKKNLKKEIWPPEFFGGSDEDDDMYTEKKNHPRGYSQLQKTTKTEFNNVCPSFLSDLWSLGCLIYRMASGENPFIAPKLKDKILNQEVKPIKGVSKECNAFIKALLKKNPNERIFWKEIIAHPWITNFDHQIIHGNLSKIKRPTIDMDNFQSQETVKRNKFEKMDDYNDSSKAASELEIQIDGGDSEDDTMDNESNDLRDTESENDIDMIASQLMNKNEKINVASSKLFTPEELQRGRRENDADSENYKKTKKRTKNKTPNELKESVAINDKIFDHKGEIIMHHIRALVLLTKKDKIIEAIISNGKIENIKFESVSKTIRETYKIELLDKNNFKKELQKFFMVINEEILSPSIKPQKIFSLVNYLNMFVSRQDFANELTKHQLFESLFIVLKREKSKKIMTLICTFLALALHNKIELDADFFKIHHFNILKDIIVKSSCPQLKSRALACLGEYMFFCTTQNVSNDQKGNMKNSFQDLNLIERLEKGICIVEDLKANQGKINPGKKSINEEVVHHKKKKKMKEGHSKDFELPTEVINLFVEQMQTNIRKPELAQVYVLKTLQNIITFSMDAAKKFANIKKLFKILKDYILFGQKRNSVRKWAIYSLLNLFYAVLNQKYNSYSIDSVQSHNQLYSILDLLEDSKDNSYVQTELLIKNLILDFRNKDEQKSIASISLLLFIFSHMPKNFFMNLRDEEISKMIEDLTSLFQHYSLSVKIKCLAIITIFLIRDYKAFYFMIDFPKFLTCLDREIEKIEKKTFSENPSHKLKGKSIKTHLIIRNCDSQ